MCICPFLFLGVSMSNLTFGKKRRRVNYELLQVLFEWTVQIVAVCLLAFLLVWCFGKRVSMIGDSMNPELANGDITLLNRTSYRVFSPKRGDVIAFRPNGSEHSHYSIKRVIGLPGETIAIKKGKIVINGKEIKERYETSKIKDVGMLEEELTLGKDEFFVLGDDRQNSEDSRFPDVGNVKRSEIVGEVWFVVSGKNFGFVK